LAGIPEKAGRTNVTKKQSWQRQDLVSYFHNHGLEGEKKNKRFLLVFDSFTSVEGQKISRGIMGWGKRPGNGGVYRGGEYAEREVEEKTGKRLKRLNN